jgi:hypothetical protein
LRRLQGAAVVVGHAGASPVVVPEQALAGMSHDLGSSCPSADPSPPRCASGLDDIAVQRHGACDWNMARIPAQQSAGGDEELLMKKAWHCARVACAGRLDTAGAAVRPHPHSAKRRSTQRLVLR